MNMIFTLTLRNLLSNKKRTLLTLLTILLSISMITAILCGGYCPCPLQRERQRDDGGQNQATASQRDSAKCNLFVNLMKKSLTFRLWQNRQVDPD